MTTLPKNSLYKLQDQVLKYLAQANLQADFYLTGGTCLARCYFHHRVSEDLDFFCHEMASFPIKTQAIINSLRTEFDLEPLKVSPQYAAVKIDHLLKVDFVADVGTHQGLIDSHPLFPAIDNLDNILANKISALVSRDEPKDIVDIWIISQHHPIEWLKVFTDVGSKAAGIIPPMIAQRLESFPSDWITQIQWEIEPPKPEIFHQDLVNLANQIINA